MWQILQEEWERIPDEYRNYLVKRLERIEAVLQNELFFSQMNRM